MKQSIVLIGCSLALVGLFGFVGVKTVQGQGRLTPSMTLHWSHFNQPRPWFRLSGTPKSAIDAHGRLTIGSEEQVTLTVAVPPRWKTLSLVSVTGLTVTPLDRRAGVSSVPSEIIDFRDLISVGGAYRFVLTNTTTKPITLPSLSVTLHL